MAETATIVLKKVKKASAGARVSRKLAGSGRAAGKTESAAAARVLALLDEAEATVYRIIASMDRSHELMQESIHDLRETSRLLRQSNAASRANRALQDYNNASSPVEPR